MKNTLRMVMAIALIALVAFALIGCDSPKSLAKQSFDLIQKGITNPTDPKLIEQSIKLQAKIEKLSEADKKIYEEELSKLFGF